MNSINKINYLEEEVLDMDFYGFMVLITAESYFNKIVKMIVESPILKNKDIAIKNATKLLRALEATVYKNLYEQNESVKGNKKALDFSLNVKLSNSFFKAHTNKDPNQFKEYRNILIKTGVLECTFKGLIDRNGAKKVSEYKISEHYWNNKALLIYYKDAAKFKINANVLRQGKETLTLKNASLNLKKVIEAEMEFCRENPGNKLANRLVGLGAFMSQRYAKQERKDGRKFTSFCNLTSVARKFLEYKGKSFHNLDLKNAQPILLALRSKMEGIELDANYIETVNAGIFYESFMNEPLACTRWKSQNAFETYKLSRDEVKQELFACIFFGLKPAGFYKKHKTISDKFKELYPKTYKYITELHRDFDKNNKENIKLAGLMQKYEAKIFLNIVPKKSEGFFTVHDCIYFTDFNDYAQIKAEIEAPFNEYGLNPSLTLEINHI